MRLKRNGEFALMQEKLKECSRKATPAAYIWDLDGTLLDSYGSITASLMEVAGRCGTGDPAETILKTVKQESVTAYLKDLSVRCGRNTEELFRMYREVSHAKINEITLVPDAGETLEALRERGAQHFVYTHRGASTGPLLARLGIARFFAETVTHEHGFAPKPSGEGVTYLLAKYALDRDGTAYVGDRTLDVLCAKDAGVQAILYLPEHSCVIPTGQEDRIIRTLKELTEERTCPGIGT